MVKARRKGKLNSKKKQREKHLSSNQIMEKPNKELEINATVEQNEDLQEDFSLLRLNCFNSTTSNLHRHSPCNSCGCPNPTTSPSCNKRSSPEPIFPTMNPQHQLAKKPKKLLFDSQETIDDPSLCGFSKNSLPFAIPEPESRTIDSVHTNYAPALRRCISDPCKPPAGISQSPPRAEMDVNTALTPAARWSCSLPPLPPTLRRTVSEPSPKKSISQSCSSKNTGMDEGPNAELNLRRVREYTKEMGLILEQLLAHEVRCRGHEENNEPGDITANVTELVDAVTDSGESVSVERTGECWILHFKCPCGKGYQILLSGNSMYYKLV